MTYAINPTARGIWSRKVQTDERLFPNLRRLRLAEALAPPKILNHFADGFLELRVFMPRAFSQTGGAGFENDHKLFTKTRQDLPAHRHCAGFSDVARQRPD